MNYAALLALISDLYSQVAELQARVQEFEEKENEATTKAKSRRS